MKKTGLIIVLCISGLAFCDIFAYDTFTYNPGALLDNTTPCHGFVGAWGAGGGNLALTAVRSESLIYSGAPASFQDLSGSLQVTVPVWEGARIGRFLDTDPNGPFADYINNQGRIGRPGQSIYISYLMKISHASPFYAFELKRGNLGDEGAVLYVGNDVGGTNLQVCAFRNRDLSESNIGRQFQWLGPATTNTELFVIRIDFGQAGDNVTVYRNPSLDAEPAIAPHLVNAGFLDFDAISMAVWVEPAGRYAQFDEICIASTYADVLRFYTTSTKARNPYPPNGAIDIDTSGPLVLSWQPGEGMAPMGYDVYFSDQLSQILTRDAQALLDTALEPYFTIDALASDTTYYWSINQLAEPNDIAGVIWTFDTEKTYPVILRQPETQNVFSGHTAQFTFEVNSASPVIYQWYNSDGALVDSDRISGSQAPVLTITNAQIEDEDHYYCKATNDAGTISSESAALILKRLIGGWTLDQGDPNTAFQDYSGSDNHLRPHPNFAEPDTYDWTNGADGTPGGALLFDGTFALGTIYENSTVNNLPTGNEPYTISIWFKTTKTGSGIIGWGGFGTYNQTNVLNLQGDGRTIRNYWWDVDLDGTAEYSLVDDAWHHVAATYDGSVRIIYIDGIEANRDHPIPHKGTNEHFLIGKANPLTPYDWFVGAVDEARIYNYALTPIDIARHYTDVAGGQLCVFPPTGDLDGDCRVTINDLAIMASQWLSCGRVPECVN